ncbi:unnamed protein product [Urochloa humidicola]
MSAPRRHTTTTSPSLRFLGLLKQPDADDAAAGGGVQELELDERDVVWNSSSPSPTTSSSSTSAASSPSPSASIRRPISASSRHFPSGNIGLSALLAEDDRRHATTAPVTAAARTERRHAPQPYHQSAPVAVPAWPKAMAAENDRRRREAGLDFGYVDDDDDDDGEPVVPPHEVAARRAAAAASVMEGAGRTLKGRDLRRVRNAVWRTTGFLDL